MKIIAVLAKILLLALGLLMIASGLVCSALGMGAGGYGIIAVIGIASALLGAMFFYLAIRSLNKKSDETASGETP